MTYGGLGKTILAGPLQVILPIPSEVSFSTSYGWQTTALGVVGGTIDSIASAYNAAAGGNVSGAATGGAEDAAYLAARFAATNVGRVLPGAVNDAAQIAARTAPHPKNEILFTGTSQREFSMNFNLASKNAATMAKVLSDLNTLYKYAAPEESPGGAFLSFPEKWTLVLAVDGQVLLLPREVQIKGITTNLNPYGQFNVYTLRNLPINISLNIEFIETTMPTRTTDERIFFQAE